MIPPDEAWADSYIVEANTGEWEWLSAEAQAGHTAVPDETEADRAAAEEQPFDLYVRSPSGVWAPVGNDWHGGEPQQTLADLVVAVGPSRAKLVPAGSEDRTSNEVQGSD